MNSCSSVFPPQCLCPLSEWLAEGRAEMSQPLVQWQTGTNSCHPSLLLPAPSRVELPVRLHGNSKWGTDQSKSSFVLGRFSWIEFCLRSGKFCHVKNTHSQRMILKPHTEGDKRHYHHLSLHLWHLQNNMVCYFGREVLQCTLLRIFSHNYSGEHNVSHDSAAAAFLGCQQNYQDFGFYYIWPSWYFLVSPDTKRVPSKICFALEGKTKWSLWKTVNIH